MVGPFDAMSIYGSGGVSSGAIVTEQMVSPAVGGLGGINAGGSPEDNQEN